MEEVMITKCSKHILQYSNKYKIHQLGKLFFEYELSLKFCIDLIITDKLPLKKFLSSSEIPVLGNINIGRWKSLIYKHASEIVRSTIKKNNELRYKRYKKVYSYFLQKERQVAFTKKKFSELKLKQRFYIKPSVHNISITIDERLNNLSTTSNSFDNFLEINTPFKDLTCKRNKMQTVRLPIKYHKHSLKFKDWSRKKTIQLQKINNNYYVSFVYESIEPPIKSSGETIGIDIGYKKLITTSRCEYLGLELYNLYNKLSNCVRSSNNYKKLLNYRNK